MSILDSFRVPSLHQFGSQAPWEEMSELETGYSKVMTVPSELGAGVEANA